MRNFILIITLTLFFSLPAFGQQNSDAKGAPAETVTASALVWNTDEKPIRNAFVTFTNTKTGEKHTSISNPFGYVNFNNIEIGQSYSVTIKHKKYHFGTSGVTYLSDLILFIFSPELF